MVNGHDSFFNRRSSKLNGNADIHISQDFGIVWYG